MSCPPFFEVLCLACPHVSLSVLHCKNQLQVHVSAKVLTKGNAAVTVWIISELCNIYELRARLASARGRLASAKVKVVAATCELNPLPPSPGASLRFFVPSHPYMDS